MSGVKQRAVRLIDVATHAGVSLATASRVLNSKGRIPSEKLRERVLQAADHLGYEPNHHARALAGASSMTIGLVVHDVGDPYFSSIAGSVVRAAEAHDMFVTIVNTYRDPQQEARYIRLLRVQRPRAIILAGSGFVSTSSTSPILEELRRFEESGGVVVSMGMQGVGHRIDVGNYEGARRLAHQLHDLGHRDFAVATGQRAMHTVRQRLDGFRAGLTDRGSGVADSDVHFGELSRDFGRRIGSQIAARAKRPTCVFGAFDVIAAGLTTGLREAGVLVPGEVSVTGFADVAPAADRDLTTFRLPLDEIGQQAVELALCSTETRTARFTGSMVRRGTVAAPPSSGVMV